MKVKRRNVRRGRIEIIPLIDTIVILLIFYMTFSRFSQMQSESALKLPTSRAGDEFKKRPEQIIVNMHSSDHVSIGGTKYKAADLPDVIRSYYANLSRTDSSLAKRLKDGDVKPSVILRGDRDMSYKDLSDFMRVCAKTNLREFLPQGAPAGITEVTFTAEENRAK